MNTSCKSRAETLLRTVHRAKYNKTSKRRRGRGIRRKRGLGNLVEILMVLSVWEHYSRRGETACKLNLAMIKKNLERQAGWGCWLEGSVLVTSRPRDVGAMTRVCFETSVTTTASGPRLGFSHIFFFFPSNIHLHTPAWGNSILSPECPKN